LLCARREASVRKHPAIGEPFPVCGYARARRGSHDLEARLSDQAGAVSFRNAGHGVSGGSVDLAPVINSPVKLDEGQGTERCQTRDLKRDKSFDFLDGDRHLDSAEVGAVVIPRMCAYLHAERAAAGHGLDADRHRAGVDPAADAGAVHVREDGFVLARPFT
jgi:hypothetical protein